MNTCDKKALRTALGFVNDIRAGRMPAEKALDLFLAGVQAHVLTGKVEFTSKQLSKFILAGLVVPKDESATPLMQMTEAELDGRIDAAKSFRNEYRDTLQSIEGYGSLEEMEETISNHAMQTKVSTKTIDVGDLSNSVTLLQKPSDGQVLAELEKTLTELYSPDGTSLTAKKASRIERTKGLKINSAGSWGVFLNEHFDGMSSAGILFSDFSRDQLFDAMVTFTQVTENKEVSVAKGFADDANGIINKLLDKIDAKNEYYKTFKYSDKGIKYDIANNDTLKEKYFYSILRSDFNFIVQSLIGSIQIHPGGLKDGNSSITGLVDELGDDVDSMLFNISSPDAAALFTKSEAKNDESYSFNGEDPIVYPLATTLNEFISNRKLARGKLYYLKADERYYFRTKTGASIDLTPKTIYSYSTKNNIRTEGMDQEMNPFDMSTAFIVNLLPMFRLIDSKGNVGRRLNATDFLALAPHLKGAGNDINDFKEELLAKANGDSKMANVARSIYAYAFSSAPTQGIHSLYKTSQEHRTAGNMNSNIVIALQNALINFDFNRYIKQEQKYVTTTYALGEGSTDTTVNIGLAGHLMKHGYTKESIGKYLEISKGQQISILSQRTRIRYNIDTITNTNNGDGSSDIPHLESFALQLGLKPLYNVLKKSYDETFKSSDAAKRALASTFNELFRVAAYNLKEGALKQKSLSKSEITHSDYRLLPASTALNVDSKTYIATAFDIDTNKRINAGGKKLPSVEAPHRLALLRKQVDLYKKALKINGGLLDFNPFLLTEEELIAKESSLYAVTVGDLFIKTPIIYDGEAIGVSEWDVQTRVKHAMIDGFLSGPKMTGYEFMVQTMNFSDKLAIPLQQIIFKENLLASDPGITKRLEKAYIEYQKNKNIGLQRIMINHLSSFIGGQYSSIVKHITDSRVIYGEKDGELASRLENLSKLRDILVNKSYLGSSDMTRGINELLMKINISADFIRFSDSELDDGADIVTFRENPEEKYSNTAILKPHLGVRAEAYASNGEAMLKQALIDHKNELKKLGLATDPEIADAVTRAAKDPNSTKKGRHNISSTDEFFTRFFLINGIYGHSVKVLSMGDESYFGTEYKQESITEYYENIDKSIDNLTYENEDGKQVPVKNPYYGYGLEEVEGMLVSQFKRAQSILTRGISYAHKKTIVGLKRSSVREDVLQYMDIKSSIAMTSDDTIDTRYSFSFDALFDKTYEELEGLGIISKLPSGRIVDRDVDGNPIVRFNVGNDVVTMSTSGDNLSAMSPGKPRIELIQGLHELLTNVDKSVAIEDKLPTNGNARLLYDLRPTTEHHLSVIKMLKTEQSLTSNNFTILPDFMPTMTMSDPVSVVNVLNRMNVTQENSDAVQFMHPLLALILDNSRGNHLGAFHTKNQEAMKFLTTTMEYDRARQILQKKSIQMPFTQEQMSKVGGPELYNMLRTMNTAMEFKQSTMLVTKNGKEEIKEFKNMEDLFRYFDGYSLGNDSAWTSILHTLARKENAANLYSFVGLISLPSNQKTGHKKLNKFESYFNTRFNHNKPNIDYTGNEFNLEVLSKAHAYDVSGRLRDKSTIALLSQLVSAVAVGGNTNDISQNLQSGMNGMMDLNRTRVGAEFASIAESLAMEEGVDAAKFTKIIQKLSEGDFSMTGYTEAEGKVYSDVIRSGIYDVIVLALDNDMESEVTKKILKDEGLSIDHPGAKKQILNTLRSALFKDVIKMSMSGFIATVSVGSNTMKFFDLSTGRRVGRGAFIQGSFKLGQGVHVTASNLDDVSDFVLPYDYIQVPVLKKGKVQYELVKASDPKRGFTYTKQEDGTYKVTGYPEGAKVIITPDVNEAPGINSEAKYNDPSFVAADGNDLITVSGYGVKPGVYFKWYLDELYNDPESRKKFLGNKTMDELTRRGHLALNITEKYSLQWSKYTKTDVDGNVVKLESDPAYRNFYRAAFAKSMTEKDLDELRAILILRTQEKDSNGDNIWEMSPPEVVLPTFMRAAYNLPPNVSLTDIIGFSGDPVDNVVEYFSGRVRLGKEYTRLSERISEKVPYMQMIRRIYAREATNRKAYSDEKSSFSGTVLAYLDGLSKDKIRELKNKNGGIELTEEQLSYVNDMELTSEQVEHINSLIAKAKAIHIRRMAVSFMKSLEVVLTRIPGQTKQSGFFAKVVEFLDAQGNAAFAPTEHLVTTGGDFDIDTLSVLTRAIDERGIIYDVASFMDGKLFNEDLLKAKYREDIKNNRDEISMAVAESNARYNELIAVYKAKLAKATDPNTKLALEARILRASDALINAETELILYKKSHRSISKKYENMLSNVINGSIMEALRQVDTAVEANTPVSFSLLHPIVERLEKKNVAKVHINKVKSAKDLKTLPLYSFDGINTVFKEGDINKTYSNPWSSKKLVGFVKVKNEEEAVKNYRLWLTTKKFDDVRPEQKKWILNEIKKGKVSRARALLFPNTLGIDGEPIASHADVLADITAITNKGRSSNGENFLAIYDAEYTAAQGKEAIQIFATVLKLSSAIQGAKMVFDRKYANNPAFSGKNNPFSFNHAISYNKDGKTVGASRYTFADLDRFSIMQKLNKSTELKEALEGISISDKEFNAKAPGALVDLMEEEMVAQLKQNDPQLITNFSVTPEQEKNLSVHFGSPINMAKAKEILARLKQGKIEQKELDEISDILGLKADDSKNKYAATQKAKANSAEFISFLRSKIFEPNPVTFKSMVSNLYGITLTNDILYATDPLDAFKTYLESNISEVEEALKSVVGRTLSMDVQSQFLSAATDNAKELILARIKSNTLTNPIITTMMLLGYEIDVIIDFLHDPVIEKIILEFSKKKNELQNVVMSASAVSDLSIAGVSPSKESLISILEIGDEISKFRAVRSLNENSKILQYQIDGILYDVSDKELYAATIKQEEGDLFPKGSLTHLLTRKRSNTDNPTEDEKRAAITKGIFDAEAMIVLNQTTCKIYRHVYEIENNIINKISYSAKTTKKIADSTNGSGEKVYKNIESHISSSIVAKFYATPIGTRIVTEDSVKKAVNKYKTGPVFSDEKIHYVELNDAAGKGKFIDNFPEYFAFMKRSLEERGYTNAALDAMSFGKTFNATNPVLGIPALRNSQPDPIHISNIIQGLAELKTDLGDNLSDIKKDLYNALSDYALIVSSGEVRKGTMIDTFLEINFELARFVDTLTEEDYNSFIPKTKEGISLIKGNYPTRVVIARRKKARDARNNYLQAADAFDDGVADTSFEEQAELDNEAALADNADESYYLGEAGYNEEERQQYVFKSLSDLAASPVNVDADTIGEIFRIIDPDMPDAIFYGHSAKEVALRIFPAGSTESNPISLLPTKKFLSSVNKDFMSDLAGMGMQIGYSAKYGTEDIQILSFLNTEYREGEKFDVYNIWYKGKQATALGVHLIEDNPGLDLRKNVIRPLQSGDVAKYNNYLAKLATLPTITRALGEVSDKSIKYASQMQKSFRDQSVIDSDPVLSVEATVIAPVLTLDKQSVVEKNIGHNAYQANTSLKKASSYSTTVLVPAMYHNAGDRSISNKEIAQIQDKIAVMFNNLTEKESLTLLGVEKNLKTEYVGGMDIAINMLDGLWDDANKTSILNGYVKVVKTIDKDTGLATLVLQRLAMTEEFNGKNVMVKPLIYRVNDKYMPIFTTPIIEAGEVKGNFRVKKDYKRFRESDVNIDASNLLSTGLAAIAAGMIDTGHKKGPIKYMGEESNFIMILDKIYVRDPATNEYHITMGEFKSAVPGMLTKDKKYVLSKGEIDFIKNSKDGDDSVEVIKEC